MDSNRPLPPEPEIEITPAMLEAGLEALSNYDPSDSYELAEETVAAIFEAMLAACKLVFHARAKNTQAVV